MLKKKLKPHFGKTSIIMIVAAAVLIAADLITKYLEEKYVWSVKIIPNFVEISHGVRNPGCAFSLLNDNPQVGQPLLITMTFILLAVIIFAFVITPERFILLKTAMTLIVAGAVGNLVDRLMFRLVRDWFGLNMFGNMTYCNLADFWIVIGAVLAVLDLLLLNEYAVFPLTKKAKAAQAARKEEEDKLRAEAQPSRSDGLSEEIADGNVSMKNETDKDAGGDE